MIALLASAHLASAADTDWQRTLDAVVPSVVSLRVTAVRDFDTEDASVSQGTGFVVDAERGLILTNRHMVHAGPVIAQAVFADHEEVPLRAVYRDPVHDFGLYAFDPALVRHQDVRALPLDPGGAKVGLEIRVVGNDAGEKISILDGTLARLDRNPPFYGSDTYNDVNTFYIQAASNTSGGSSGSPVVDQRGTVVALNAGGATEAASSFYLPLDRVVRTLELVREGRPITRGGLLTTFLLTPFDELRRLGLSPTAEDRARAAAHDRAVGMLVVADVVPGSPAEEALTPGDVLVEVGGELILGFAELEEVLDEHVGERLEVLIERGGTEVRSEIEVSDLQALSPATFLEQGRAVFHDLSLLQARNHHIPVQGVYVAVSGYSWNAGDIPSSALITELDGERVPDLDTFQQLLEGKSDGQRMRVRFSMVDDIRESYETVVVNDRRWHRMARCTRDDALGTWPCVESPPPPPPVRPRPPERLPVLADDRVSRRLATALVLVEFDIPHPTAGVKDLNYVGVGTVIDAERGLVLVDRDTVPVSLGDMTLTFAGTVRVPGHLVYLHPIHDLAVIGYDPSLLGDLPVSA
ncbi:MAG: trypsin-like peptidase domain-containing protein, partial [Myxococcales bacterium]|nr:trypsin-like peptidase domain-containing protein [Myxococcales bacterium]